MLTNFPIKQILLKSETSGRLAKWAIELGEHDISYRPCTDINGKTLVDFLLEIPGKEKTTPQATGSLVMDEPKNNHKWTLYTNRVVSKKGLGASLILTSPEGEEITYALLFDFHTSNYEAEYKALLTGLRLAKNMGAESIVALTDSRLDTNQINKEFETRDKRMEKYVKAVQWPVEAL